MAMSRRELVSMELNMVQNTEVFFSFAMGLCDQETSPCHRIELVKQLGLTITFKRKIRIAKYDDQKENEKDMLMKNKISGIKCQRNRKYKISYLV